MDAYQDATRRGVAGRARLQDHPFVIALEECSTTPVLGANDVVSEFLSTHNKLDLPINLQVLNGRSRRIRDLEVKYLPSEDETLQRIYRHSGSSVNWFRRPYAKVYLVCCDNLADYKKRARPRLRELIEKNDRLRPGGGGDGDHALSGSSGSAANPLIQLTPWLVLYLQGASNTPQTQQQHKKVFQMIKDDFNSSKYSSTAMYYNSASTGAASGAGLGGNPMAATAHKGKADRVCQLVIKPGNAVDGWEDLSRLLGDCVKISFECRLGAYLSEVRNLALLRRTPGWSFDHFFLVKGSLAHMFEQAHVYEEAVREYYELEVIYTDTLEAGAGDGGAETSGNFGDQDPADEEAFILHSSRKNLRSLCKRNEAGNSGSLKEFDVRQYLFAKRALLMLKEVWAAEEDGAGEQAIRQKRHELARLGQQFISSFTRKLQRHSFRAEFVDKWVFSACLQLASVLTMNGEGEEADDAVGRAGTGDRVLSGILADLYIYCHSKLLKLGATLSLDAKRSRRRQKVSKSMIFASPKAPKGSGGAEESDPMAILDDGACQSFEEELILMETEAAVAAAREAAVMAESAIHDAGEDGEDLRDQPRGSMEPGSSHPEATSLSCLESREGYNLYVLSLAREAAEACRRCGRERQAVQLEANNSDILIQQGEVAQARRLLEQQCRLYFEDGWLQLLADLALPQLVECQLKLGDRPGLLSSLSMWLTMKGELEGAAAQKVDEEAIQSALEDLGGEGERSTASAVDLHGAVRVSRSESGGSGLKVLAQKNDVAVLAFTVDSFFPFPVDVKGAAVMLSKHKGGEEASIAPTEWVYFSRASDTDHLRAFSERLRTGSAPDAFAEAAGRGEGSQIAPGGNVMFAAVLCSEVGKYQPTELTATAYGCQFRCGLGEDSGLLAVSEEEPRVTMAPRKGEIFQLDDQMIAIDVEARGEAFACEIGAFSRGLAFKEAWAIREGDAGPPERLAGARGGVDSPLYRLGDLRGKATLVLRVEGARKAAPGRRDGALLDCELSYTSGLRRTLARSLALSAVAPFEASVVFHAAAEDKTLVELRVASALPWGVVARSCELTAAGEAVSGLFPSEDLLPARLAPGATLTLLYELQSRECGKLEVELGFDHEKGHGAEPGGAIADWAAAMEASGIWGERQTFRGEVAVPAKGPRAVMSAGGDLRLGEATTLTWRVFDGEIGLGYEVRCEEGLWVLAGQTMGTVGKDGVVALDCIPLESGSLPSPELLLGGEGASGGKVTVKPPGTQTLNLTPVG